MLNHKSQHTFIFFLFFAIGLIACESSENDNSIYVKAPEEKLDKYCNYLKNPENASDSAFKPFFYKRFNQLVKENKIDSAAQVLYVTGRAFLRASSYDEEIIQTHLRFLAKYKRRIADKYYSNLYGNVGNFYNDAGKFDTATVYLKKSIIEAKDNQTLQNNAYSYYNLIFSHLNNGKLEQALSAGIKSLQLHEKLKDTSFQSATYSGIACIYQFQDDYDEALKYEAKGLELLKKTTDTSMMLLVSLNKIALYNTMDHKNLFPFIDSTVALHKAWKQKTIYDDFPVNCWLAFKLVSENKLPQAKIMLDKLKIIFPKIGSSANVDYYLNALSEYEVKAGKGSENIPYYLKRIPELKENEDYLSLQFINQILHDDALLKKDYKSALKYLEQVQIAKDSLSNKTLRIKVKEFDKKYQTVQKERKINLQETEISKKNSLIGLLAALMTSLVLLATIYYLWQRQKNLTQEKNNSMNFTKQLLENTETERKRIASDLHDSISHELLNLKSGLSQDISVVSNKIDVIINDIRGISRNLHPVMFDKIGLQPNIEALVERIQYQNDFMVNLDIDYGSSLTSSDELQIYRIIQEALTNVIKYADAYAAKITILDKNDKIFIEIRDNGKGFNVKSTLNSGKAFGLHNIIERSRAIGGQTNIQSSQEGTVITINIPKK